MAKEGTNSQDEPRAVEETTPAKSEDQSQPNDAESQDQLDANQPKLAKEGTNSQDEPRATEEMPPAKSEEQSQPNNAESQDQVDAKDVSAAPTEALEEHANNQESSPSPSKQEVCKDGHNAAGEDEDDRKVFVGGLPQTVAEAEISEYFARFGSVTSVNLKTDQATGRSRGFAFVIFASSASVEATMAQAHHEFQGKTVAVKRATAKQGKVYVGHVPKEVNEDQLREAFSKYGTVVELQQPFDRIRNEKKNFAFITFSREQPAKTLLKAGSINVAGHDLDVKRVTPKPDNPMGVMMPGGMPGRGRGRGGGTFGGWGGGASGWSGYGDFYGGYQGYDDYYGGGGGWMGYGNFGGYSGGYDETGYSGGKPYPRGGGHSMGGGRGIGRGRGGGPARSFRRGARPKPY